MPESSKFEKELCYGVRIVIEDNPSFSPIDMGISLIYALNHLYEDDFELKEWLNYLTGMNFLAIMEVLEEDALTREDLLLLFFETPAEYVSSVEQYYLY